MTSIAAGASDVLRERKRIKVGWLTPLLVIFLIVDLTSFWILSYRGMQDILVGFPSMICAVAMALTYFFAATLAFPKRTEEWDSLDAYYMQHYRWVIGGVLLANIGLLALLDALKERGFVASWLERLSDWDSLLYFGLLIAIMTFPRRIVHLACYAIMLLGYAVIMALNPALSQ